MSDAEPDEERIDEAALALMFLTLHDGNRTWKQFDWDITHRLHEKGLIENPRTRNKSIELTERGLQESERLFHELFVRAR